MPDTGESTIPTGSEEQLTLVAHLRRALYLKYIDLSGRGLEIGPYGQPTVLRSEARVAYLDRMSREELAAECKFPDQRARIPEIDYVVTSNRYSQFVPEKFDYVIANHVMEHIPNLIQWLMEMDVMLAPGGVLCLALPDRKFTFDKYRPVTRLSHILAEFYQGIEDISIDHFLEAEIYYDLEFLNLRMVPSQRLSRARLEKALETGAHIGYHCHVFESETVLDGIFRPLLWMKYANFEILDFVPAALERGGEMLLVLKKVHPTADRGSIDSVLYYKIETAITGREERQQMDLLQAQVEQLDQESQAARAQIEQLKTQLGTIVGSKSWKLTRPLRDAAQVIRDLRSRLRNIH